MKKIPTLFEREFENHRIVRILPNISPDLAWVMAAKALLPSNGTVPAVRSSMVFSTKDTMPRMGNPFRPTPSSVRRTQTLSQVTCLVGCLVTDPSPATNGFGMRMTGWTACPMEHMRPSAHISEQTHTISMPMYSSPMGKTLLNWIGALKASALIWKPM